METTDGIELTDAARGFLKALASDTRQQILLLFSGETELTVGQVAERLDLAQSAASAQLATLRDSGVLVARQRRVGGATVACWWRGGKGRPSAAGSIRTGSRGRSRICGRAVRRTAHAADLTFF